MYSYAEFIEMTRANVPNYAFVRRVIEIKSEQVIFIRSPRASPAFKSELHLRLVISLIREEL